MDRRVPMDTNDEVGRLSHGFNRMLEQLSTANRESTPSTSGSGARLRWPRKICPARTRPGTTQPLAQRVAPGNASKVRLAALGQLAAQLAHEIGTPLSSVSGHLQLALSQRDLSPNLRERLDVSTREIARIGRIVRDYLDSTRSLEAERKLVSLRQVLSEAVEVTRGGELGSNKTLNVDVPAIQRLRHRSGLLRQIVINLLSNALDAVEHGGVVALTAQSQDDHVLITVRDTGTGIAPRICGASSSLSTRQGARQGHRPGPGHLS